MNRREFLKKMLAASGVIVLTPQVVTAASEESDRSAQVEIPPLPWGYVELDPEYVRKLGHLGYYAFECSGGAFWAIMIALREKMGFPYTTLPLPSVEEVITALEEGEELQVPMHYGAGGGGGYGSLCGALNGACAAMNMAIEIDLAKAFTRKLFRWYEKTPIPSDISNEYAATHQFLVPKYKTDKPLPQSVSESVLCHTSVSLWCVRSGYASGSKERSERCGRLTGDVAAAAVEFMNAHLRGEAPEAITFTQMTTECRGCHYKGKDFEEGQFTRGYMQCESCHTDMRPHLGETPVRTAFGVDLKTWAGAATVGTVAGIGSHLVTARVRENGNGVKVQVVDPRQSQEQEQPQPQDERKEEER